MTPTKEELESAHCWFSTDAAGGVTMAGFKREARYRQHLWAKGQGITEFGTHPGRRASADAKPERIVNGTKLLDDYAEAGRNFLTDAIHDVAEDRIKAAEPHETLDAQRLRRDLLSSMPMAFNLFAEASLPENEVSRNALAKLFGAPETSPSKIVFEWSPGRRNPAYTRDRTAFDVALLLGAEGSQSVVGIETKYHEHSLREPTPKQKSKIAHQHQTEHLVEKANVSGVFVEGWEASVLDTDLRQIWRDHLLALTMRQNGDRWTSATRYVLLYPRGNVSFADAVRRYAALLAPGDDSFAAFTIEEVLDAAFAHGDSTRQAFHQRYLEWMA